MRISKEKAAENRAALIRAASKLFRERGIDGVGVAEISKAAGLTHGALYAHFKSKEELALMALAHGFEQARAQMYASTVDGLPDLAAYLDGYLSGQGRDDYSSHCPMSASASEIGRQDHAISARFAEGYMVTVRTFERQISSQFSSLKSSGDTMARAMVVVAALVGTMSLARGMAKGNPALSDQVLKATRQVVDELMLAEAGVGVTAPDPG